MASTTSINTAFKSGHGSAVISAAIIGAVLADIIPTPADAIFFHYERKIKNQYKSGEITPKQYWNRKALAYYSLNPIWWALVGVTTLSLAETNEGKLKILLALLGGGAVLGVIHKNIKKDTEELNMAGKNSQTNNKAA
jgi:hypothetical protein